MLQTSEIVVEGVRARVRQAGDTSSEQAVVFVHGNPGPSDDWEFVAADVADFSRVVLIDMPGFGLSDRPRGFDYTVDGYARFLGGALRELRVQEVHLVLHDFGGGWGLRWAADHLNQVRSITLINCGVMRGYTWHKFARVWQTPVVGELFQLLTTPKWMLKSLNDVNPKPMPLAFVERIFSYADWGHKRAVLKLYRNSKNLNRQVSDIVARLGPIDTPTLVLWGEGDSFLPVKYAHQQREVFSAAEVHVLKGCGHWPFIDDPDAVRRPLVAFLQKQAAAIRAVAPGRPPA